jgi:hypothetical protein
MLEDDRLPERWMFAPLCGMVRTFEFQWEEQSWENCKVKLLSLRAAPQA